MKRMAADARAATYFSHRSSRGHSHRLSWTIRHLTAILHDTLGIRSTPERCEIIWQDMRAVEASPIVENERSPKMRVPRRTFAVCWRERRHPRSARQTRRRLHKIARSIMLPMRQAHASPRRRYLYEPLASGSECTNHERDAVAAFASSSPPKTRSIIAALPASRDAATGQPDRTRAWLHLDDNAWRRGDGREKHPFSIWKNGRGHISSSIVRRHAFRVIVATLRLLSRAGLIHSAGRWCRPLQGRHLTPNETATGAPTSVIHDSKCASKSDPHRAMQDQASGASGARGRRKQAAAE